MSYYLKRVSVSDSSDGSVVVTMFPKGYSEKTYVMGEQEASYLFNRLGRYLGSLETDDE